MGKNNYLPECANENKLNKTRILLILKPIRDQKLISICRSTIKFEKRKKSLILNDIIFFRTPKRRIFH
jgi:hypothetical protein